MKYLKNKYILTKLIAKRYTFSMLLSWFAVAMENVHSNGVIGGGDW